MQTQLASEKEENFIVHACTRLGSCQKRHCIIFRFSCIKIGGLFQHSSNWGALQIIFKYENFEKNASQIFFHRFIENFRGRVIARCSSRHRNKIIWKIHTCGGYLFILNFLSWFYGRRFQFINKNTESDWRNLDLNLNLGTHSIMIQKLHLNTA